MLVELVRTVTTDGHRLDGALLAPPAIDAGEPPVDAFLFLHGVGGNFYAGNLFDHLASEFARRGVAVLRVNTRGHDAISMTIGRSGVLRQGAAYEIVDECRHDVMAWVEFLQRRGFPRVGLLGHSLGGIKAIYSQAVEPSQAVQCVVACSAPRLSYSAFMNSDAQPPFFESMSVAREHVERGQPDQLILAKFPAPVWITAAGYIDKYGPAERYNILNLLDRVSCPLLATYGELELNSGGVALAGMVEAVLSRRREGQQVDAVAIPQADHAYTGVYPALSAAILGWLVPRSPKS